LIVKDDGSSSQHVFDILHEPDNKEISDLSQISQVVIGDLSLEMNQESPIVKDNGSTSKEESNIKVDDAVQKKNGSTSKEEIKMKVVDDEVQKRNDTTSPQDTKITVDDVVDVQISEVEKEAIEALGKLKLDKSPMSVKWVVNVKLHERKMINH